MNISEGRAAVEAAFLDDIPLLMWGSGGVGKSSLVHQLATDEQVELRDLRLSQIDSIDLRGGLKMTDTESYWIPPRELPKDPNSIGILFFDELNHADDMTKKAAYQLIHDRKLGEYILPPGWRILAAGNPGSDRIPMELGNRFMHITITPDVPDWAVWAHKNNLDSDVIGLLMARPELLLAEPTNQEDYAYPSPRTWEFASRIHAHHKNSLVYKELITGLVGNAAYIELVAYYNMLARLPNFQQLLAAPTTYNFNDSPSKVAAMCLMIVAYVDTSNIDIAMEYINTTQTEFQVLTITLLNESKNSVMGSSSITAWCLANPNIF